MLAVMSPAWPTALFGPREDPYTREREREIEFHYCWRCRQTSKPLVKYGGQGYQSRSQGGHPKHGELTQLSPGRPECVCVSGHRSAR